MVIFHSYVSLPEGNHDWQIDNLFSDTQTSIEIINWPLDLLANFEPRKFLPVGNDGQFANWTFTNFSRKIIYFYWPVSIVIPIIYIYICNIYIYIILYIYIYIQQLV